MSTLRPPTPRIFRRSTWREAQRVTNALRTETVGGALLLRGRGRGDRLGQHALGGRLHQRCGT